ncbi:MAG: hypothetical protein ABIS68_07125, partial [Casimicrobiaceae bacterium]
MSDYVIWWMMAAILVGVELATGTFFLLALDHVEIRVERALDVAHLGEQGLPRRVDLALRGEDVGVILA